MDSILAILKRLHEQKVEFVIVGGVAGVLHGSSLVTEDLDICAPLTPENLSRILAALEPLHPRWRMPPHKPTIPREPEKLAGYRHLYLLTDAGVVNVLSEITGLGEYSAIRNRTIPANLPGIECRVIDIESLITAKRALGRPKDLQSAAELEAIREKINGKRP